MTTWAMRWTKAGEDRWTSLPLEGRFRLVVAPKGDGRWAWEAFARGADDPMASGIVGSLAAAKNAAAQFLTRAGYV